MGELWRWKGNENPARAAAYGHTPRNCLSGNNLLPLERPEAGSQTVMVSDRTRRLALYNTRRTLSVVLPVF